MRRDMDLVRYILLETEAAERSLQPMDLVAGEWNVELVGYHVEMMAAHGLLDARVHRGGSGRVLDGAIQALTWDGADYLDAIRSDTIWKRTKDLIATTAGSVTIAVIKEVASLVALQAIKAGIVAGRSTSRSLD